MRVTLHNNKLSEQVGHGVQASALEPDPGVRNRGAPHEFHRRSRGTERVAGGGQPTDQGSGGIPGNSAFPEIPPIGQVDRGWSQIFPAVNRALDDINHAVSTISTRGERNALTIQTHTTFGQRWLIPRLFRFHERFKNIDIRLTSSIHPFNPDRQNIQAAIQSGDGSSESCDCDFIAPIELIPVCSPSLIEPIGDRDDFKKPFATYLAAFLRATTGLGCMARVQRPRQCRSGSRPQVRELGAGL